MRRFWESESICAGDRSGKDVLALAEALLLNLSASLSQSSASLSWKAGNFLARFQAVIVSLALLSPDGG